jgi:DNA-binding transcriptional ArsR family regulator
MEAATPLRQPRVSVLPDRLLVDDLVVDDETAVRLAAERAGAGEDPVEVLLDAIEIGARVLDREQAGATVEVLRADLEKTSREVEARLGETSEQVVTELRTRLEEAFGPDQGHVTRVLHRHFGADSTGAVQHQVRAAVAELLNESRERLFKQFSSAEESNPLASFQRHAVAAIRQSSDQQHAHLREMNQRLATLQLEVAKLQAEKAKAEEVAAEHERSTAKGRPYEEAVFEAIDAIAGGQGDDCDAVGDLPGVGGRKGDVLVGVEGCSGPPRARIVFEAKNSRVARKVALAELDEAMAQRDAAYGVWVVPAEDKLPARTQPLREAGGDKLFVVYDPDEGSPVALELAYRLARARALMARGDADGLDATALRAEVERALGTMEEVRRVKQQLTHAANGIEAAREIVESLDRRVRGHLAQIDGLLAPAADDT